MVCLMLILQCETPIAHKHVWQCLEACVKLPVAISFVHVSVLQYPECVITKFQFWNACISSESESLEWESNSCKIHKVEGKGVVQAKLNGSLAVVHWSGFSSTMMVYSRLILKRFYTSSGYAINITMNPKELEHVEILTRYHHPVRWT